MRIFGKIFLGFWVATFAMISALLLVSFSGLVKPLPHRPIPDAHRLMFELRAELAGGGIGAVGTWLEHHPVLDKGDIAVADTTGRIVFPGKPGRAMRELMAHWPSGRHRFVERRFAGFYIGSVMRDSAGANYRVIVRLPPPWQVRLRDDPWLGFIVALVVSGLVCFIVARVLTRPLARLGDAVGRLARGDLQARVELGGGGRDEIHRLAEDFNHMAEQLAARIADQQRLVKDVSHELRSPLARMRLALALAREDGGPGRPDDMLGRMEGEVEKLEAIVSDLLLLPQAGTGQFRLDEVVDLPALVQGVLEDCRAGITASEPRLVGELPDKSLLYRGNGRLLYSALANLVQNGLRYTPTSGEVRVTLTTSESGVQLCVHDGGPGVPAADLVRIFEPFYRVSAARDRSEGGTGLGLAIVRRATELHGGAVSARNTDRGLKVCIELPAGGVVDDEDG